MTEFNSKANEIYVSFFSFSFFEQYISNVS